MNDVRPTPTHGAARPGELEVVVSTLLRVGLAVSMATIAVGLALMFARRPGELLSAARFARLVARDEHVPHRLAELVAGILHGDGEAIIAAGLALLILTPVMRVAASLIEFARGRDRAYTIITAGVLAVLLLSLLMRAGGG